MKQFWPSLGILLFNVITGVANAWLFLFGSHWILSAGFAGLAFGTAVAYGVHMHRIWRLERQIRRYFPTLLA